MSQTDLKKRVIDLTYKLGLTHLGSCLNAVSIIDNIYKVKKENEPFILAQGHAALALYVVLEKYYFKDAEVLFKKYGTHPYRNVDDQIWCSTGSLGQGLGIGVGMALADRKRNVYVVTSDGDMAEGSNWEALRVATDYQLENLRITCIANGFSGYKQVDSDLLDLRMQYFYPSLMLKVNTFAYPDWLQGVAAHYEKLTKERYEEILKCL